MSISEKKPEKKGAKNKVLQIIINGQPKEVDEKRLSYKQVIELAFPNPQFGPNIVYTVTYKNGPKPNPKGVMVEGDVVKIKEGMLFNVTRTDKS
ncbi:MAG: multiubiquitin domain-containing protein [Balneola sp.]